MCGLFGFCAKKGQKANLLKLKMLGVVNTTRGIDSCGYYFSGHLAKGVDKMKDFTNFAAEHPITRGDGPVDIFLGHTRKSTFGLHNEKNAHPHLINDNYIQTHNGVITNEIQLSQKYKISFQDGPIDSLILANIIEKYGFNVLEEYEGYAALAMVWKKRPESIFLFHGAHKDYFDDKYSWIERPLYILEQPEGLYYSSMVNSLDLINETGEEVVSLPTNAVYEVRYGKLLDNPYIINRQYTGTKSRVAENKNNNKKKNKHISIVPFEIDQKLNYNDSIFTEPIQSLNKDLYYQHGRYYNKDGSLLHGEFIIDRDYNIISPNISKDKLDNYRKPEKYYFIRGVMVDNEKSYHTLKNRQFYKSDNVASILSLNSIYPVICLENEYLDGKDKPTKYLWYKNGAILKLTTEFKPKFSDKSYKIRNGQTINIILKDVKLISSAASNNN